MKLLVIEDNPKLSESMAAGLRTDGFAVDADQLELDGSGRA